MSLLCNLVFMVMIELTYEEIKHILDVKFNFIFFLIYVVS